MTTKLVKDRLHVFREYELKSVLNVIKPGLRVLEIGAGDGYLARKLEDLGCDVTCLDIVAPTEAAFHEVIVFDGHRIPFEDGSFDALFSCHMLYHVISDDKYLRETARVLKPGGIAAHILPTATWRLLTAIGYYTYLIKSRLCPAKTDDSKSSTAGTETCEEQASQTRRRSLLAKLSSPPLSAAPSWLAEMKILSAANVRRRITQAGFEYLGNQSTGVVYTAYRVLQGFVPFPIRKALSVFLGSSSRAYIFRKPAR